MLTNLTAAVRNRTTYRVGLLQDKAYRRMKKELSAALAPFEISSTEWALLGLLHDKKVMYPSEAAEELGVEAAFVTVIMRHLTKRGFATEEKDTKDTRRKLLCLTAKGSVFVTSTERVLRSSLRSLIEGVSPHSLTDYFLVLERIISNAGKDSVRADQS